MIKITINEKNDYLEVIASEKNSNAMARVNKKDIEKYQRGEVKNDPIKMAEIIVKKALKDHSQRSK